MGLDMYLFSVKKGQEKYLKDTKKAGFYVFSPFPDIDCREFADEVNSVSNDLFGHGADILYNQRPPMPYKFDNQKFYLHHYILERVDYILFLNIQHINTLCL